MKIPLDGIGHRSSLTTNDSAVDLGIQCNYCSSPDADTLGDTLFTNSHDNSRDNKMKRIRVILSLFAIPFSMMSAAQAVLTDCQSNDDFICAMSNPEDLLSIPGSSYVMISNMENAGHLYVTNTADLSSQLSFPGDTAKQVHDKENFPSCPGPLTSNFRPHGLALREGENGVHTLYVVGHGDREAIEVFQLNVNAAPKLTWQGCVIAPEKVSLNSVAPLPNGAFAATNFNLAGGEVWEWQPTSGWAKVPGSDMLGPNGLITSKDGEWFYIGAWNDEALVRLSRGKQPPEKQMVKVDFHIDNVRWGMNETILVAGQKGVRENVGACLRQGLCDNASTGVALIDEQTLSVVASKELPVGDKLKLGTVAIKVNGDIWVGGIGGSTHIGRFTFNQD